MEIIVKLNKLNDLYIIDNADSYLLSNRKFSYRFDESFCINKVRKVKTYCKNNNKKVYMLINKIFKDHELNDLKIFMEKLIKADIDGIFFTDFAVFMIAKELNAADKCVFYHETFLRNSYDIVTYQDLGIKKIVCSKDMHINDIKNLPLERKNDYGIICFGYIPLYESQRQIISHYVSLNKLPARVKKSKELSLKENTRDELYKVIEQEGVSSIFNSEVLTYIDYMDELRKNINMFIFDGLFFKAEFIRNVINLYKDNKKIEELKKLDESIKYSDGFINKRVGLM